MAMEDMWRVLQLLQQDINNMCQVFKQLQVRAPHASQNSKGAINQQVLQPIPQSNRRTKN